MEKDILSLPADLVQFAGIRVEPTINDEEPTYFVTVGCTHLIDPKICSLAVSIELQKKWKYQKFDVTSFCGIIRDQQTPLTS